MQPSAETPQRVVRLADGILLSIGPMANHLVNVITNEETPIDYRYVEAIERNAMGGNGEGLEEVLDDWLKQELFIEGEASFDPVMRQQLAALDEVFISRFRDFISPKAAQAYEMLLDIHCRRKRFFERVGQCPVFPETALRRALLVGDASEVGKKNVLCVGDDDLVSVALSVLGHNVTVFDIDDYLIRFLRDVSSSHDLNITVEERDLRDPLEGDLTERFDVFMTDPMSNRDCFEIFLSRALALLKPDGVGFSAVYSPVTELFETVIDEMGCKIENWHRRHNRYYSKYFRLHNYESDWVEIRKTPHTKLKHPPDEFCVPLNLYREDYHQHPKAYAGLVEEIEDARFATPTYLEVIFDGLEELSGKKILHRFTHMGRNFTVVHATTDEGYVSLYVDRTKKFISVDMLPFDPGFEEHLRRLLVSAYKTTADNSTVTVSRNVWEVRVR